MLKTAQWRAKKAGIPCTITVEDIRIPERCPVLGIELKRGTRGFTDNSPTLDRVRPELGYVPGNVCVISFRANSIKREASLAELEKVTEWVRGFLKSQGDLAGPPLGAADASLPPREGPEAAVF